jgi:anhydro-N-acetylmuramic acid kinase
MRIEPNLYLGMLSGTSRDGVDAVLVRFAEQQPKLLASLCVAYPAELEQELRRMIERRQRPDDDELAWADQELADFFALAAWALLDRAGVQTREVAAIGSHGQTVWHKPAKKSPESIQLGDPQRIADLTGIRTVGRFREADLQLGGQGAPLAPLLHAALLKPAQGVRAVLNLGGIANISLLHASGTAVGYDTGPGNCLLDTWIREHEGHPYDRAGQWAAGGQAVPELLDLLLADPYFAARPPKSTGVEYFNLHWLRSRLEQRGPEPWQASQRDIQATLSELTARTVAMALRSTLASELLVCGGGAHNADLLGRIRRLLPGLAVEPTSSLGIDPDWMEGILFAWLARERIAGRPQDTRCITGARRPVLLGEVFEPLRPAARPVS